MEKMGKHVVCFIAVFIAVSVFGCVKTPKGLNICSEIGSDISSPFWVACKTEFDITDAKSLYRQNLFRNKKSKNKGRSIRFLANGL
jgi:hypothetical protein